MWQIRSDGEMGNAHDISLLVMEHGLHPLGMDDDRLLDPPYSWHDRAHLTHLTTIVGHVQLLRRWVTRTESLTASEHESALRHITAIEQASWALYRERQTPSSPTEAS